MRSVKRFIATLFLIFPVLCSAGISEWVTFSLDNGHIKIPVLIDGIETTALLDTGAQGNAINKAFITKHGLSFTKGGKMRIQGVFGEQTVTKLSDIPLTIFGVEMDVDGVPPASLGHHTTGFLVGAGFFSQFVVQLDYPNSRMRVLSRDAINLADYQNIKARSQRGSGEPLVKVTVGDNKSFWALLDTGSNGGVMIERGHAQSLGLLEKADSSSLSMGVNSIAVTESARATKFTFGPYTLENVLISFPAEGQSINVDDQYSFTGTRIKSQRQRGILGYDVLKHFVLTLDYRNGLVHIGLPEDS